MGGDTVLPPLRLLLKDDNLPSNARPVSLNRGMVLRGRLIYTIVLSKVDELCYLRRRLLNHMHFYFCFLSKVEALCCFDIVPSLVLPTTWKWNNDDLTRRYKNKIFMLRWGWWSSFLLLAGIHKTSWWLTTLVEEYWLLAVRWRHPQIVIDEESPPGAPARREDRRGS